MRSRPRTLITECATRTAVVAIIWTLCGCSFDQGGVPLDNPDAAPAIDALGIDASTILDSDSDGIANADDNCPNIANPNQENMDGDAHGNACDNCPGVSNDDQADVIDGGDGVGDACDDQDSDSVVDALDNCWEIPNTGQENGDADSFGDACDNCPNVDNEDQMASDGDSFGDACDLCPAVDNENQSDEDNDKVGDVCDNCPSIRNANQNDVLDSDGVGDACDPRPNQAGDSILFFDGFAVDYGSTPAGWSESTGPSNENGIWTVSGGKLRQARSNNSDPAVLWRNDLGSGGDGVVGNVLVETILEAGGTNPDNDPYLGLVAAYTDDGLMTDQGYACAIQRSDDTTQLRFQELLTGIPATNVVTEFTMDTGSIMQVFHYQYGGTTSICQSRDEANEMGRSFTNNYAGGQNMGAIGVTTANIAASFRHITVYQLGGPLTCPGASLCF